jgi:hypothetical protein
MQGPSTCLPSNSEKCGEKAVFRRGSCWDGIDVMVGLVPGHDGANGLHFLIQFSKSHAISVVIARLNQAIHYSRMAQAKRLWNTGCPACAGHDNRERHKAAFSRRDAPELSIEPPS